MNNNDQQYVAMRNDAQQHNKSAVFDVLTAAGITKVTAEFDGYGDSGQIQSITAGAGESDAEVPPTSVTIHAFDRVFCAGHFETIEEVKQQPLAEAIEGLCYDCLEERHGGWEINEGSFGTFEFNVADRTISLEFNERSFTTDFDEF